MIQVDYYYIETPLARKYLDEVSEIIPGDLKGVMSYSRHELVNAEDVKSFVRKYKAQRLPVLVVSDPNGDLGGQYYYDDITHIAKRLRLRVIGNKDAKG